MQNNQADGHQTRPNINPIPNQTAIEANTHGQNAEVLTQPNHRHGSITRTRVIQPSPPCITDRAITAAGWFITILPN